MKEETEGKSLPASQAAGNRSLPEDELKAALTKHDIPPYMSR